MTRATPRLAQVVAERGGQHSPARDRSDGGVKRGPTPRQGSLLLTLDEAGERLGIARSTLYGLLQRGELISVSIGRRRFVRTDDLAAFVASLTPSVPHERRR